MINNMEKSYVSFMWNDRDLHGVLTNAYQLRKFGSKYPYSCITTEDVSDKVKRDLTQNNIKIVSINYKEILVNLGFEKNKAIYIYNKIHFVCLYIYALDIKGVYLDADILILKNLDSLFEKDTSNRIHITNDLAFSKKNKEWVLKKRKKYYNAGVICFESNQPLFNDMMNYLKEVTEKDINVIEKWTDQEVFNHFINNNVINVSILDFKYNMWSNVVDHFINNFKLYHEDDLYLIHFTGSPKPWLSNAYDKKGLPLEKKYWFKWFEIYMDFCKSKWLYPRFKISNTLIEE